MKRSIRLVALMLCSLISMMLLVQLAGAQVPIEEGDIEESFEEYGDDSDEVYELDDAIVSPVDSLLEGIRWLGHASFLIEDEKAIYIDPFDIPEDLAKRLPDADIILITHDHSDHFSPPDIMKILKPTTVVVSIKMVVDNLPATIPTRFLAPPGTFKAARQGGSPPGSDDPRFGDQGGIWCAR